MEYHEAALIFPADDEHIDELAEDIKSNGQEEPIKLYGGKILDGRRRWLACQRVGVKPVTVDVDSKVNDPVAYVISLNLHRRNLTPSQRAYIGANAYDLYEKEAKKRQKDAGKSHGKGQPKVKETVPEPISGQARDKAGKAVGVSGKTIDMARKVKEKGTEKLNAAVSSGKVTVSKASAIAELPSSDQDTALDSGDKAIKAAAERVRRKKSSENSLTPKQVKEIRTLAERLKTLTSKPALQVSIADVKRCVIQLCDILEPKNKE